ncbi:MAG: hypothetical protein K8R77_06890 [Anaerolineaceae bacterium]|nr:hypothetical protein [Anaerolineaceae bacterium]
MNKKRLLIISSVILLTLALIFTVLHLRRPAQWLTFAECEEKGGGAWPVDLYHSDICPACAAYRECESVYNDYSETCPECYGACPECQAQYSLHESCPECYEPCQNCQNKYLNNFKSDEERYQLCPDCKVCDSCREELNTKIINCPACISCNECKEENKKCDDISEVCPDVFPCAECMEEMGMYPDKCPGGMEKLGNISDAAMWVQCCK